MVMLVSWVWCKGVHRRTINFVLGYPTLGCPTIICVSSKLLYEDPIVDFD